MPAGSSTPCWRKAKSTAASPKGRASLTDPMAELNILRDFDFLEIEASSGDSKALHVHYAFGDDKVRLEDIVEAKRQGLPYLETENGWIDLSARGLRGLESFIDTDEAEKAPGEAPSFMDPSIGISTKRQKRFD